MNCAVPERLRTTWPGPALVIAFLLTASPLTADSPAEILEKGIYAEETQGDLANAIAIYKSIAETADVERPTVAQALLRLGMCYRKAGRNDEASEAFRRLTLRYPEQKALLAQIPMAGPAPLRLLPVPWTAGETLVLRLSWDLARWLPGVLIYRYETRQIDGKAVTDIENDWGDRYSRATVDSDTLQPRGYVYDARRSWRGGGVQLEAVYSPGTVEVSTKVAERESRQSVPLSLSAYDASEIVHLLRCLPLADDFRGTVQVLGHFPAQVDDIEFQVTGREQVVVPAGTFDTFKVQLEGPASPVTESTFGHPGDTPRGRTTIWYTADARRYPVKVQDWATWELAEMKRTPTSRVMRDAVTGFSIVVPRGWDVAERSAEGSFVLSLVDQESRARGIVQYRRIPAGSAIRTTEELADNYPAERGLSGLRRQNIETAGVTTATLLADRQDGPDSVLLTEYAAVAARGDRALRILFHVDPARFERLRPALDDIIRSVRFE
jgi:hypothetical protein